MQAEDWAKSLGFKYLEISALNPDDVLVITKLIRVNANFIFRKRMTKLMLQETSSAMLQKLLTQHQNQSSNGVETFTTKIEETKSKDNPNPGPAHNSSASGGRRNTKRATLSQDDLGLSLVERQKRKLIKLFSSSFTVDSDTKTAQRLPEEILGKYSKKPQTMNERAHSKSISPRKKQMTKRNE